MVLHQIFKYMYSPYSFLLYLFILHDKLRLHVGLKFQIHAIISYESILIFPLAFLLSALAFTCFNQFYDNDQFLSFSYIFNKCSTNYSVLYGLDIWSGSLYD